MNETKIRHSRASRYAAPIGGVFIVLCVIGFFSLLNMTFNFTRNLLDNSNAKASYEARLLPVTMFDPPPFENPVNLRDVDILLYSLWATVLGDNRELYKYDDNMSLVVPASDVDMAAYNLFGPDVVLKHGTFGDYENSYLYDESTKSYHVPVVAMTGFYTPSVKEIVNHEGKIYLTVGYIPPETIMNVDFTGKDRHERTADKYMTYEMRKGKNGYYLYAIRDVEGAKLITGIDAGPQIDEYLEGLKEQENGTPEEPLEFLPQQTPDSESTESTESSSESSSVESSSGSSSPTSESESSQPQVPSEIQG